MGTREGKCSLTGESGPLVKCHIIPRSLTYCSNRLRRGKSEALFIEISVNHRPKLAPTSWFDSEIVSSLAENRLSQIDTTGLEILKRHSLVESAVGSLTPGPQEFHLSADELCALRRFLLSILWRAAETTRPEFAEVSLDIEAREKLRKYIIGKGDLSVADFPIAARRLVGNFTKFNTAPYRDVRQIISMRTGKRIISEEFIFYMSGLYVSFGGKINDVPRLKALKDRALGHFQVWIVDQVNSDEAMRSLAQLKKKASESWPADLSRMAR